MRFVAAVFLVLFLASCVQAQSREEIVRNDKKKVEAEGFWIYNNLPAAFAEARKSGKPIVVVLRCLPCHECVKLDDELVNSDPKIRPLLEKFVCARQVSTNGLDLDLFQYDTDQSFAVFFLNADKTIYGRFGTRSHRTDWANDVSVEGLGKALRKVLELHANFDRAKKSLQGKTGTPMEVASPEMYPSLFGKFSDKLNYAGNVVKSCIHCHQIGDAQREYYWHAEKPIPEKVLFPFPHPKSIGLIMDPAELATVKKVSAQSAAANSGLKDGDVIESFQGQPILSIADMQWVLHQLSPDGDQASLSVLRNGKLKNIKLDLAKGWRRNGDLSWRVTSWGLRRIAAGGMLLAHLSDDARKKHSIGEDSMGLLVEHVGQYGAHAAAKRAGVRKGDILTEFDSRSDFMSEQEIHAYVVTTKKPGDNVTMKVLRNGKSMTFNLPIQK